MKYFIIFLAILPSICQADCVRSMESLEVSLLQAKRPPSVVKEHCQGKTCVCLDHFPYPLNTDSAQLLDVIDGMAVVNVDKETVYLADLATKAADKTQKESAKEAILDKAKASDATINDLKAAIEVLRSKK